MSNLSPEVKASFDAVARLLSEWITAGEDREERESRFFSLRYEVDHESVFLDLIEQAQQWRAAAQTGPAAPVDLDMFTSPPAEVHDAILSRGTVSAYVVGHLRRFESGTGRRWFEPGEGPSAPPPGP